MSFYTTNVLKIFALVAAIVNNVSDVECYGIEKVAVTDTSRRNVLNKAKQIAVASFLSTATIVTSSTSSVQASDSVISACPPRSQNCIRTTWIAPKGTKDASAAMLDLFQQYYPQEGQNDVDKGGWAIVDSNPNNGTARLEFKSGIGNFAKYFNGGKPFIDDVIIQVSDNNNVEIRSASRVGDSDFGVNQKRLQFLASKARELGWEVPDPKY